MSCIQKEIKLKKINKKYIIVIYILNMKKELKKKFIQKLKGNWCEIKTKMKL